MLAQVDDFGISTQSGISMIAFHFNKPWWYYLEMGRVTKWIWICKWLPIYTSTLESQKKLTHWNQIRDEWPNEEIHLYGPGTASGTYDYFAEVICGKKIGTRGDYTASEDDNVLVQGVSGDKYSLGFFGLAYYEYNKDKLSLVPVDNGDGPITPSSETVNNGTYSPLSRPIFIYISDEATKRKEVVVY